MATNLVYRNTDAYNRVETLAATYGAGVPVLSLGGKPAVTVTASGDHTRSDSTSFPPYTISGIPDGGAGLVGKQVTLAFDGTWEFPNSAVAGTTAATATQGQVIYVTSANALTTTVGSNVRYGTVDFPPDYDKTRGFIPIKIGG